MRLPKWCLTDTGPTLAGAVLSFSLAAGGALRTAALTPDRLHLSSTNARMEAVFAGAPVAHPVAITFGSGNQLWLADASGRVLYWSNAEPPWTNTPTVFLEGLPSPTSLLPWGHGLVISASPDLIYAEDTNSDGHADLVRRIAMGFGALAPDRRAGSLSRGLDGWLYGSSGRGGGIVSPIQTAPPNPGAHPSEVDLASADFRLNPTLTELEPLEGPSEAGRAQDPFGRWFASDAEGRLWHYPLAARYTRRNPAVQYPEAALLLGAPPTPAASPTAPAPLPGGLTVTIAPASDPRSRAWTAYVCDPVHSRVLSYTIPDTLHSDISTTQPLEATPFLSSTDPSFVPVQALPAPDGALWIVDAGPGTSNGALLRVTVAAPAPPPPEFASLGVEAIVRAFPGCRGSGLHQAAAELLERGTAASDTLLRQWLEHSLTTQAPTELEPLIRALWLLRQRHALPHELALAALAAKSAPVREQALILLEPRLANDPKLPEALATLANDPARRVRLQLALSLGESHTDGAADLLGRLLARHLNDPWIRAAILSSSSHRPDRVLTAFLDGNPGEDLTARATAADLVRTALRSTNAPARQAVPSILAQSHPSRSLLLRFRGALELLDSTGPSSNDRDPALPASSADDFAAALAPLLKQARDAVAQNDGPRDLRLAAIALLGHQPEHAKADCRRLLPMVLRGPDADHRRAAANALLHLHDTDTARQLFASWPLIRPSLRPRLLAHALRSGTWIGPLLQAIQLNLVGATEISPANRDALLQHPDAATRECARSTLAQSLPVPRPDLAPLLTAIQPLEGRTAHGRELFTQTCTMCHALGGLGVTVGPNLDAIGLRTRNELLLGILDPNAAVEPRFLRYEAETIDDQVAAGILRAEHEDALELVEGGGAIVRISWDQLRSLRVSNLSFMPEGIDAAFSPQDLADLVAWIQQTIGR